MIDFRSDTLTKPSPEMRRAMAEAEVGDEQYLEDPTVNRLQELVAELTGKEAALFVPSGTMCNAIAFAVHCRPGDAVILERRAHPNIAEGGGPAIFSSVMMRGIDGERGVFTADQVRQYLSNRGTHTSKTAMISVDPDKEERLDRSLGPLAEGAEGRDLEWKMTLGPESIRDLVNMGPSAGRISKADMDQQIEGLGPETVVTAAVTITTAGSEESQ